ncbi:hypothetical protein VTH82DRAFT_3121 [Thermothelomyces myriococcoides]
MGSLRAANSMLRGIATGSASRRIPSFAVRHLSKAATTPISQHIIVSNSASTSSNWACRDPQSRLFSHTPACQRKKSAKQKNKRGEEEEDEGVENDDSSSSPQSNNGEPPNPFDFSDVQAAFDRVEKRFSEELKTLRSGGRSAAEMIGAIPVQLGKQAGTTCPLHELATVAPFGGGGGGGGGGVMGGGGAGRRRWSILAFDEASVKPIINAVQRAEGFGGQQPQRIPDNPLELTVTVEPERADALARRAKDVCQAWRDRIRDETHRRTELHKKWRASRLILSDDVHRLKEKLQKLQDDRMKVIQAKEKEIVAAIMARG